jgi:3-isopropylmalate/(R)-2-methylmalate dehydratase small subunit
MKQFGGNVLFLDRSDINTDEIIPAKYLTTNIKEALKPHILEDLKLPGFDPGRDSAGKGVIVARDNFGCGSSREHAPWVLELNGINIVIASSFARIFRQNMYNCGMIACELPAEILNVLFGDFAGTETELTVDLEKTSLSFKSPSAGEPHAFGIRRANPKGELTVPFVLKDFERALVEAGGWVDYAAKHY